MINKLICKTLINKRMITNLDFVIMYLVKDQFRFAG